MTAYYSYSNFSFCCIRPYKVLHIMTCECLILIREYMKRKFHSILMPSSRLVVFVKLISRRRNEMFKMAGVWVNCIWRRQQNALTWNSQFPISTCIKGNDIFNTKAWNSLEYVSLNNSTKVRCLIFMMPMTWGDNC